MAWGRRCSCVDKAMPAVAHIGYLAFVLVDRPDFLVEAIRRARGESTASGNAHLNDRRLVVFSEAKRLRDDNC